MYMSVTAEYLTAMGHTKLGRKDRINSRARVVHVRSTEGRHTRAVLVHKTVLKGAKVGVSLDVGQRVKPRQHSLQEGNLFLFGT